MWALSESRGANPTLIVDDTQFAFETRSVKIGVNLQNLQFYCKIYNYVKLCKTDNICAMHAENKVKQSILYIF